MIVFSPSVSVHTLPKSLPDWPHSMRYLPPAWIGLVAMRPARITYVRQAYGFNDSLKYSN